MHKEKTPLFINCNRVTPGVQEKDGVCYFWSQLLFGAFLSVKGHMVFINGFHRRWLSSELICPHGLCLCLDVWFAVFVLIFTYVGICCPLRHGHIKVLEVKYNFCEKLEVLGDLVSTAENTVCKNFHLSLEMFASILKKMSYFLTSRVHPYFSLHFCPCRMQLYYLRTLKQWQTIAGLSSGIASNGHTCNHKQQSHRSPRQAWAETLP